MAKVRENDGAQLGFRFKFVVFCLGQFFSLFSLFSSIWIAGAARGEKKPEKKSAIGDCGLNGSI
jgi:hypothetical protein